MLTLRHDGEGTICLHLSVPLLVSIYLSFDLSWYDWLEKLCGEYKGREYGFDIYMEAITASLHVDPMENPTGLRLYLPWERVFKGKSKVYSEVVYSNEVFPVTVPAYGEYPEKMYTMKVNRKEFTTKWTRWRSTHWDRWEVECEEGVPHPGKGTCSYNCGEDSLFSCSFGHGEVSGEAEAIRCFIEQCTWYRKNYPR
ncbi:MAG: hypothetical protein V3V40_06395 [Nitrosomonadaceae bacterium]